MKIIEGKKLAQNLNEELKTDVINIKKKFNLVPCLKVILVGSNSASNTYVKNKETMAKKIGIDSEVIRVPSEIKEEELLDIINKCNLDSEIDGLLVQLPLPRHINSDNIIEAIDPQKDVDGFHPINLGLLALGRPDVIPCTPMGCLKLLKSITTIQGKNVIIIGRSSIVGKPLSYLLTNNDATVTLAHSKSENIKNLCNKNDILIAAVGIANKIKKDWIKKEAIVLDVGINFIKDDMGRNKLVGDVDFNDVLEKVSAITPVPGGIGPMTIHCLLENTVKQTIKRKKINYKLN
tara:strand:+ start:238 stop:1113 length:876 start_codon:yes stop_codon:yes gene_type:complete